MAKTRSLRDVADDVVRYLNSAGGGHDVSNEPRVPKGHGEDSGEWTSGTNGSGAAAAGKAIASARGATVTISHPDGTVEVRHGGSRAWRNNNPGNIEAGPKAISRGAIGSDGRFAIFPDEATGEAAMEAELDSPRYSSLTIDKAVEKRTPSKDKENDTERTKALVRQFSGLSGDSIIEQLSPVEKQRLYGAIRRSKGWQAGSTSRGRP